MEEELLKELDSILNPAIQSAWSSAKRMNYFGGDPRTAFLENFKIEMDHTKVDLSKTMYKLDLAMQGHGTDVARAAEEMKQPQEIKIDIADYVREKGDGTEVFDGTQWYLFSKESQIDLKVNTSSETSNVPLVQINAYDPTTDFRVVYVDHDATEEGHDYSYAGDAEDFQIDAIDRSIYYKDPFYGGSKLATGSISLVAGELEAFTMAQHYVNYDEILRNPLRGGRNYGNGAGRFKMLDGKWANFDEIRNTNGFRQQGLKVSANSSRIRGANAAKGFKIAGKVFFGISIAFTGLEVGNAMLTNDSNRHGVYGKAAVDVVMGVVAFIPVVGWAISGTYFIADAFGAFGDWGKPSGISQEDHNMKLLQEIKVMHGNRVQSLEFQVDYSPPIENRIEDLYNEEREVKIDNTMVAPRVNIQEIRF